MKNETVINELNGIISTNQTGKFPKISQRGNEYIMVLNNYDSNAILVTAIKGRKGPQLLEGYEKLYSKIEKAGIKPVMKRLDNEASDSLVASITEKQMKYQLAAPYSH